MNKKEKLAYQKGFDAAITRTIAILERMKNTPKETHPCPT